MDVGQGAQAGEPRVVAGFPAMLEDSADDLYENAPCGNLSTLLDGTIAKINATLLGWLGYTRDELVGRRRFSDLLTGGGRIYHETSVAPLLSMRGELGGVALDLRTKDGRRFPVLLTSAVKNGGDGRPQLIRTTVFDARERRAYEQELLHARRQAEREGVRLRALIEQLQRSLLPSVLRVPPGLSTAAYYRMASADHVGGDFYDLFDLSGGRWGFFLGDVSGKGVEAAAVTALARYTLRAAAVYDPDPAAVLRNLNAVLYQEYRDEARYCTVVFGVLTLTADGFTAVVASGGHPEPLLLRADGSAGFVPTRGRIVGAFPSSEYTVTTLAAGPGDTLVLYSDGVTEARTGGRAEAGQTAAGQTETSPNETSPNETSPNETSPNETSPNETSPAETNARYGTAALARFAGGLAPTTATGAVAAFTGLLDAFGAGLADDAAIMAISIPPV